MKLINFSLISSKLFSMIAALLALSINYGQTGQIVEWNTKRLSFGPI